VQQSDIAAAAEMLAAARRGGQPIDGLPEESCPQTLAEAYLIQDALIPLIEELSGGQRVGYKAGATVEAVQKNLGLEAPFRGVLVAPFLHASGVSIPAEACHMRVLECEFAFRMAEALPPAAAPYDPDGVRAAVGSFLTSIEVVDFRYAGGFAAGGLQVIADNSGAGHWIAGAEFDDLDIVDFEDFPVDLLVNGETVQQGNSANVLGNPLHSLTWLANDLCLNGGGLRAGDIVTAGSCTTPHAVDAGDRAVADFGFLGRVSVNFEA
jgi:2-keto-4-pentenoate hydratase